jgi:hypothetical protein
MMIVIYHPHPLLEKRRGVVRTVITPLHIFKEGQGWLWTSLLFKDY